MFQLVSQDFSEDRCTKSSRIKNSMDYPCKWHGPWINYMEKMMGFYSHAWDKNYDENTWVCFIELPLRRAMLPLENPMTCFIGVCITRPLWVIGNVYDVAIDWRTRWVIQRVYGVTNYLSTIEGDICIVHVFRDMWYRAVVVPNM